MATVLRVRRLKENTWTNLPAPSSLQWDIYDIDSENATRNDNGDGTRDRVAIKRKLICEWPALSGKDMSTILKAITDEYFVVEYPDALENTRLQKVFYVGDRSAPMYSYDPEKESFLWEGLSCNFIQR